MAKTLIIGGSGFIGSHLVLKFLRENMNVWVYDKSIRRKEAVADEGSYTTEAVFIEGDILDRDHLFQCISEIQPEVIVHLACSATVREVSADRVRGYESIVTGTFNIIEAIIAHVPACRLVYISSSMVYGDFQQSLASEEHPKNPKNLYGVFKLSAENILNTYRKNFNMDTVIVRPSAVYGPDGTNPYAVIQIFFDKALRGEKITVHGDGTVKLDFTYVEDLVNGIYLASTQANISGETFNLTFGESRQLNELINVLRKETGPIEVEYTALPLNIPKRGTLDIAKAKALLNYQPSVNLEEGIKLFHNHLKTSVHA